MGAGPLYQEEALDLPEGGCWGVADAGLPRRRAGAQAGGGGRGAGAEAAAAAARGESGGAEGAGGGGGGAPGEPLMVDGWTQTPAPAPRQPPLQALLLAASDDQLLGRDCLGGTTAPSGGRAAKVLIAAPRLALHARPHHNLTRAAPDKHAIGPPAGTVWGWDLTATLGWSRDGPGTAPPGAWHEFENAPWRVRARPGAAPVPLFSLASRPAEAGWWPHTRPEGPLVMAAGGVVCGWGRRRRWVFERDEGEDEDWEHAGGPARRGESGVTLFRLAA
jgi:hypothetical protein